MPSNLRSNSQSGPLKRSWVSVAAIGSSQSGIFDSVLIDVDHLTQEAYRKALQPLDPRAGAADHRPACKDDPAASVSCDGRSCRSRSRLDHCRDVDGRDRVLRGGRSDFVPLASQSCAARPDRSARCVGARSIRPANSGARRRVQLAPRHRRADVAAAAGDPTASAGRGSHRCRVRGDRWPDQGSAGRWRLRLLWLRQSGSSLEHRRAAPAARTVSRAGAGADARGPVAAWISAVCRWEDDRAHVFARAAHRHGAL